MRFAISSRHARRLASPLSAGLAGLLMVACSPDGETLIGSDRGADVGGGADGGADAGLHGGGDGGAPGSPDAGSSPGADRDALAATDASSNAPANDAAASANDAADANDAAACPDAPPLGPFEGGAAACAEDIPWAPGGQDTGYRTCGAAAGPNQLDTGGTIHRPTASACPNPLVAAAPGSCTDPSGTCTSNADCTGIPNGTCVQSGSIQGYCECSGGCISDSDCAAGQICFCENAIDLGTCLPAKCAVDSDCGAGLLCAYTAVDPNKACPAVGDKIFTCQTPADSCLVDSDCPSGCGTAEECVLDDTGVRSCSMACSVGPLPNP